MEDSDPILRQVSNDLVFPMSTNDQELINRMVSYVDACYNGEDKKYQIRPGIALAGPQVGLTKKVIYLHFNIKDQEYKYLIANPKIISESMLYAYIKDGEGCLSVINDYQGVVRRRNRIIIKAYDLINKKDIVIDAEGILAICLQHEIDHLNGILFYDKINKDISPNKLSQ
jgi:peptide deformylase